jgi:glucosamine--fructose-6-phosphate aminotransferase (isomerizing)
LKAASATPAADRMGLARSAYPPPRVFLWLEETCLSDEPMTQMRREIGEIPSVAARQLAEGLPRYREEGRRLRREAPRFLVTCARGSSDQAALFLKYLVETRIGIPVASVGPAVASVYEAQLSYDGGVCLTVSQSGGSPDIASLQRAASRGGARTVALLNTTDSLVGREADVVLPLLAGPEKAVAATKSYVASLVALIGVLAGWCDDAALIDAMRRLPETLEAALRQDWSAALLPVASSRSIFTIGRGPGLAIAGEAALKFKETCRLHAEAYSAAEVRHGPIALAGDRLCAFLFAIGDGGLASIRETEHALRRSGATVFGVGGDGGREERLSVAETGDPVLDALSQIVSFYGFVETLAVGLRENPDSPTHLRKITETV